MLEVSRLASRVYQMEQGKIIKEGTPASVLPVQTLKKLIERLPSN
jgi:ABC-type branched-subunit amino acid transport system ATPase component